MHSFISHTIGSMDFGGSALNKSYNTHDAEGSRRMTSDVFALATAVLFQSGVQHFALAPNNLEDAPAWAIEFMKSVPTIWDEVRYIDGYPGRYVILARRCGDEWYVVGINAQKEPIKRSIPLTMFSSVDKLTIYCDNSALEGEVKELKLNKKGEVLISIPTNGGVVITNKR